MQIQCPKAKANFNEIALVRHQTPSVRAGMLGFNIGDFRAGE
jgi:hypothetical protein